MAFPLSICQSILYKCLLIFKWQKCAAMDDDFWGTYMGMVNIMFGMMIGTIRLILGNLYHKGFEILSGIKVEDQLKDNKARYIWLSQFHFTNNFCFLCINQHFLQCSFTVTFTPFLPFVWQSFVLEARLLFLLKREMQKDGPLYWQVNFWQWHSHW